ncbi:hypothetical protein [Mesorhizobium sp. KR2-14]|uniref:hypothetical protein n=1 Tax=Mesorhizobium sp. KR2-14 TaxID=3156610 RepID=UPI0032B34159
MDIDDWAKVKGSARRLMWWSAWTPAELAAFKSVTIAGAGYLHSLGYKATQAWFEEKVCFEVEEVVAPERARPFSKAFLAPTTPGAQYFNPFRKGVSSREPRETQIECGTNGSKQSDGAIASALDLPDRVEADSCLSCEFGLGKAGRGPRFADE